MAQFDNRTAQAGGVARPATGVMDEGLRAYMLRVYNYMAAGVALTGLVSLFLYSIATTVDPAMAAMVGGKAAKVGKVYLTTVGATLYMSPLKWVIMFAPLAMCFLLGFGANRMSVGATQLAFWVFAALVGASLSVIFLVYTQTSIARIFFITSAAFGALSLWAYTTKKDLSGWGTFLFMGLIGIIIASIVNIWLASPALMFAVSAIGVLVFAGLTAYDTQMIKDGYYDVQHDGTATSKAAVMGAFALYTDFINLFQSLLSLFGDRE
jgi:uncharacterized protein